MFTALKLLLYERISPDRLAVRNVKKGVLISEPPEVAISVGPKKVVLAVGAEARPVAAAKGGVVINPFSHPRTLVGNFTVASQLIEAFILRALGGTVLRPAPVVVMHPLGSPEGGFTQVERRAFREMAMSAGASEVILWVGRELNDQEVLSDEVLSSAEGKD